MATALRGGVDEDGAVGVHMSLPLHRSPWVRAAPTLWRVFTSSATRLAVVECARFEALAEFLDERVRRP